MAQTPKSAPSKNASMNIDSLVLENKLNTTKKSRVNKPKVTTDRNIDTKESNNINQSTLVDIPKPSNTLELAPSNLAKMVTPMPTDEENTNIEQTNIDKLKLVDINSPVGVQNQDNPAYVNQSATVSEFTGFTVPSGCGNVLKAEREAQGLSLSEVCKSLRLSINQIQAIEQDDFVNLPKQSIVRGFIRNYARLLKIDSEPILKAFQNIVPDEAPLSLSVKATADESVIGAKEMKFTPKIIINILMIISVMVAISYLYTHFIKPKGKIEDGLSLNADEIQKNSPDMMALPLPNSSTEVPDKVPSSNVLDSSNINDTSTTSNTDIASTDLGSTDIVSPRQSTQSGTVKELSSDNKKSLYIESNTVEVNQLSQPTNLASVNQIQNLSPTVNNPMTSSVVTPNTTSNISSNIGPTTNESQLSFKLSGESWIRVETPSGKTVFSELLPAGSNQSLYVKPPFNIIIGNAGVTKVMINNQDYDLTTVTRSNVARVQIK